MKAGITLAVWILISVFESIPVQCAKVGLSPGAAEERDAPPSSAPTLVVRPATPTPC